MNAFALPDIDLAPVLVHFLLLGTAFVIALPIAWDRDREERTLGLRGFPIVTMASAGFILIGRSVFGPSAPKLAWRTR